MDMKNNPIPGLFDEEIFFKNSLWINAIIYSQRENLVFKFRETITASINAKFGIKQQFSHWYFFIVCILR